MLKYRVSKITLFSCAIIASNINRFQVKAEEDTGQLVQQPSFLGTTNLRRQARPQKRYHSPKTINDIAIVTGTAHPKLAKEVAELIGIPLTDAKVSRYSDGEVAIQINESLHGKTVFIIQPCAAPVNDSIVELLLTTSCANRAAADRVIAVVPYFGYKHHRRGSPISTTLHSRFLSSSAMDFAKMLQEMGVDHVITVDLQRPGQGHEACFFANSVPLETILTKELIIDYFAKNIPLSKSVIVISPNTECVKKAKQFQIGLKVALPDSDIQLAVFDSLEIDSGPIDPESKLFLGNVKVTDYIIILVYYIYNYFNSLLIG
jgi:ribose-phosphate pyrophosphokinase